MTGPRWLAAAALTTALLVGCANTVPPPSQSAQRDWAGWNDDPATATPITLDFRAADLTITPCDLDWFTFTLDQGAPVIVGVWTTSPGLSPLVVLPDDALQLVAAGRYSFGAELAAGT
jgi:hypothetical protein